MNTAYAIFHGFAGITGSSPWYVTLAVYYFLLGLMRLRVVDYERRMVKGDGARDILQKEIAIYKGCSIGILVMTTALSGMVILTIHSLGGAHYPGMTIYVMALYTFVKVPLAVWNWIAAKKRKTLYLVTIRSIVFADACMSVLSLQTAMFAAFGGTASFEKIMNGITGGVVCILVFGMGIYGVYCASAVKKQ